MRSEDIQRITASRLRSARACKRLHHIEYDLAIRPVEEQEVLRFGTLVHRSLEAWWRAQLEHRSQDEWLDVALEQLAGADPFDAAKARVLMVAYHVRWKDEPYEVLAVEAEFKTPLRNPETGAKSRTWMLAGKIDAIVRDPRDGLTKVVEHKTTSENIEPGSEYWRRLRMDGQVSVYFDGGAALGHTIDACVYDVIAKPAQRPSQVPVVDEDGAKIVLDRDGNRVRTKDGKKWRETASAADGFILLTRPETPEEYEARLTEAVAAAPEKYLGRGDIVRLEAELDEARYDMWQTAREIREGQVANRFPRNPDACVRYGRTCPFFDVCTGVADLHDPHRFTRLNDAHPELAGSDAEAMPKEEALTP